MSLVIRVFRAIVVALGGTVIGAVGVGAAGLALPPHAPENAIIGTLLGAPLGALGGVLPAVYALSSRPG